MAAAGFQHLSEGTTWTSALKPGGACVNTPPALRRAVDLAPCNVLCRYYYLRNNSTIIAFRVGANVSWSAGGYKILGAHTDSPCLKMKPMSLRNAHGFVQAGVETYAAPHPMPNFTTTIAYETQTITSLTRALQVRRRPLVRRAATATRCGGVTFAQVHVVRPRPRLQRPSAG